MANWTKLPPCGMKTRKKWNLEDQQSLRNLKYHLAEDGCSDVQFTLAKQLLEENTENDPVDNHTQGVHWLLRAAQQGHEAAITLLNDCYQTGRGINESNEADVRNCLDMSPGERAARRAAQELFATLSNGEEYVTAAQLERRMREIYNLHKKRRKSSVDNDQEVSVETTPERNGHTSASSSRLNQSPSSIHTINHISEANLLTAAVNYSNGRLPSVSNALTLSVPDPQSLDHVPCFHRPFFHPIIFFSLLYHRFITLMSSFPGSSFTNFQMIFVLMIYAFFSSDNLVTIVPIGGYYISLIVMLLSSFKMLKTKHDFIDFRMWSRLFLSCNVENLNTENSENQFLRNNLKPYLYFFVAFFVNLMLLPMISDQWLPGSEITVISFVLTFVTMFAFMYTSSHPFPDYLILFSFGHNVLAKYPYEMDSVVTTGWRFLDLKVPAFSTFVIGNGIEFCLSCRALLYLMIPGFLTYMAYRRNWRGIYAYLIPHCVTLSWLQICIISSQSATMFGLVRAALGLSGLLLFLPLFGIVTLLIPVFAAVEWLSIMDATVRLWSSIIAAGVAIVVSGYMAASRRTEKYITFLQIAVCLIATVFLTIPYMTSNFETNRSQSSIFETLMRSNKPPEATHHQINTLNWDSYYKFCHQPAWERVNKIKTQLRCSHLDGTVVRWEGTVMDMEISSKKNLREEFITSYLPKFIADSIVCYYGDQNVDECELSESCDEVKNFLLEQKQCNLDKWNSYEYEIKVRMASGILSKPVEVIVKAQHTFGNFTQSLNTSDRIWFIGVLRNFMSQSTTNDKNMNLNMNPNQNYDRNNMRLGRKNPLIELQSIGCIHCHDSELTSVHLVDGLKINARMKDLLRGIKYLLNVIFNPLVIFK